MNTELLNEISLNLQQGKAKLIKELVQQAIDEGIPAETILNDGLMAGMNVIGEKFKNNDVYIPEVLIAARAMNNGAQVLKPYLAMDMEDFGQLTIVSFVIHGKNMY